MSDSLIVINFLLTGASGLVLWFDIVLWRPFPIVSSFPIMASSEVAGFALLRISCAVGNAPEEEDRREEYLLALPCGAK
jgi:hypothetical protein